MACFPTCLSQNYKKRSWGEGPVIDTILKTLKIPHLIRRVDRNKNRIIELMNEFYKTSQYGTINLSEVESDIALKQAELDTTIYDLYQLSEDDKNIIEEYIKNQEYKISRTD